MVVYHIVTAPLRATRRAAHHVSGAAPAVAAFGWLLESGLTILIFWWVYWHVPEVRAFIQTLPTLGRALVHYLLSLH